MTQSSTVLQKIVLIVGIVAGLYIAMRATLSPAAMMANLDITLNSISALNEVRGQYGGFFLAFSLVLGMSLFGKLSTKVGLIVFLMTIGGVLFGRLLSLVLDGFAFGSYTPAIQGFMLIDLIMFVLVGLAIRQCGQVQ